MFNIKENMDSLYDHDQPVSFSAKTYDSKFDTLTAVRLLGAHISS